MAQLGKTLLVIAAIIAVVALVLLVADRLGLGRLPGDLVFRGKKVIVHFPIVTSILISVVLTVLLNLWLKGR